MESKHRGFEEVPLVATNVQLSSREQRTRQLDGSQLRQWRVNLAVLSQVYNLYIIACNDQLHIYEPSFPDQILSETPNLIIHPPVSAPNLEGYVSPHTPHSINNIIVDFLGNEEIILFACDDGDILGYETKYLHHALQARNLSSDNPGHPLPEPQPFFHENVGISAWGLAVHRESRMIAVSCNSCSITVFAFALTRRPGSSSSSDDGGSESESDVDIPHFSTSDTRNENEAAADGPEDFPHIRAKDHRIELRDNMFIENIPCISFCNMPEDSGGRWLMAGTIAGYVCIWDIYRRKWAHAFATGFCYLNESAQCDCSEDTMSYRHAVWSINWLDWRSFHQMDNTAKAVGTEYPEERICTESVSGTTDLSPIWNISESRSDVRASGLLHGTSESYSHFLDDPAKVPPDVLRTREKLRGYISERSARYFSAIDPEQVVGGPIPTYPIMVVSCKDVMLRLPQPSQHNNLHFKLYNTHTGMHQPLYQLLPRDKEPCPWSYHRHNMTVPIPELGVVVVATGMGRAGIFTLTTTGILEHDGHNKEEKDEGGNNEKNSHPGDEGDEDEIEIDDDDDENINMNNNKHAPHRARSHSIPRLDSAALDLSHAYTFRLDHIVPFSTQERDGERPTRQLVGVSAGPVQGMLGRGEDHRPRRWRLFLLYRDRSVLSYELGKSLGGVGGTRDTLDCLVI